MRDICASGSILIALAGCHGPPPAPASAEISLHGCAELVEVEGGSPQCLVNAGQRLVVAEEIGDPAPGSRSLLVWEPSVGGPPVPWRGPDLDVAHRVTRGEATPPGGAAEGEGCVVSLRWDASAPVALPPALDAGAGSWRRWLDAAAAHPSAATARACARWAPPLKDQARPGGAAQRCAAAVYGGDPRAAVSPCLEAAAQPEGTEAPEVRAATASWLAYAQRASGQLEAAARSYEEASRRAQGAGLLRQAARALHVQAHTWLALGEVGRAQEVAARGLSLTARSGDRLGALRLERMRASALLGLGRYSDAWVGLERARDQARWLGDDEEAAKAEEELGRLATLLGDPIAALSHFEAARPFFDQLRLRLAEGGSDTDREDLGTFLGNRAWAQLRALRRRIPGITPAEIASGLEEAVSLFIAASRAPWVFHYRARLVELALASGDAGAARQALAEALSGPGGAAEAGGAEVTLLTAEIALAEGDASSARWAFEDLMSRPVDPEIRWWSAYGLARALSRLGREARAWAACQAAMGGVEAAARGADLWSSRGGFIGEREEVYRFAEGLAWSARGPAEALGVSERARLVQATAQAARARLEGLRPEDAEALSRRTQALAALARAAEPDPDEAILSAAERRRLEGERAHARERWAAAWLSVSQWLDDLEPLPPAAPIPAEEVAALLAPGERLLALSATDRALTAYLIGPQGVDARLLELAPAALEGQVDAARRALMDGSPGAGAALAEALVGWADLAGVERLLIIPWGPLHRLPIHALPLEGGPLVARVEVAYAPGIGAWAALRQADPAEGGAGETLVVADPRRDLPGAAREGEAIAALHPGSARLAGDAARAAALLGALPAAGGLHYAGHASLGGGAGLGPNLALAQEGRLGWMELLAAPRLPRWVILSGCETAGGELVAAGEVRSLVAGFLGGGARQVVASFWPMRDGEALAMMVGVHRRLVAGERLGAALRAEALAARGGVGGASPASPHLWAAFALWGDPLSGSVDDG